MKKIAVLLSGCGVFDGSEIIESVSLMISLSKKDTAISFFSLDEEKPTVNHLTSKEEAPRNLLVESARITRGDVKNIDELSSDEFDGLALPGGFGFAKNFSNWATQASACQVHSKITKTIQSFYKEEKPILAMCIAPAIVSKVLGEHHLQITLGSDSSVKTEVQKTGVMAVDCPVNDFITDRENKIITTPAYMCGDAKPHEVFEGIEKAVHEFVEMA